MAVFERLALRHGLRTNASLCIAFSVPMHPLRAAPISTLFARLHFGLRPPKQLEQQSNFRSRLHHIEILIAEKNPGIVFILQTIAARDV
jgi:hypothetical protein